MIFLWAFRAIVIHTILTKAHILRDLYLRMPLTIRTISKIFHVIKCTFNRKLCKFIQRILRGTNRYQIFLPNIGSTRRLPKHRRTLELRNIAFRYQTLTILLNTFNAKHMHTGIQNDEIFPAHFFRKTNFTTRVLLIQMNHFGIDHLIDKFTHRQLWRH